jgi:zinc-ribbon domain
MSNQGSFCPGCGTQLPEGTKFCTNCGAHLEAGSTPPPQGPPAPPGNIYQGPPVPPGPAYPVQPPGVPPGAPGQFAAPPPAGYETHAMGYEPLPAKKRMGLILGIIGGVVVVAGIVVLILFLTVFNGGGGGGTNDPTALANKYISALQNKNTDSYMDCFEADYFENMAGFTDYLNMDPKEMINMMLKVADFKFSDVQFKVQSQASDSATVVTTAGKGSVSVMGMNRELDMAQEPLTFNMIKNGGRWYMTEDPLGGTGLGESGSSDFDFEGENPEDWLNTP